MKQSLKTREPGLKRLIRVLSAIDEDTDMKALLSDLCTPAELKALSDRLTVAQLVQEGEDYRSIAEKTGCSTATVTRVARSLKYGEGGYQIALECLVQ